jgi:hypothetical protein
MEGIFVLSLAGIVYIVIRSYPIARIQEDDENHTTKGGRVDWNAIYRVDTKLLVVFEKLLRKARVFILKIDNEVSQKIDRVKKKSGEREGNGSHVLMELNKQNAEEKTEDEQSEKEK